MKGWRRVGLVLAVNTAGAIVPTVIVQLFRLPATWRTFGTILAYSAIYAYSIGTLAWMILGRIGKRVCSWPRIYAVLGMVFTLAGIAVVGSVIANGLFVALGMNPAAEFRAELEFGLKISVLGTVLVGSIVTLFEGFSYKLQEARLELRTRQLEEERARKLASEAKLSSLESRVQPHFLFNTLNSISELIREDPVRAERTVERLAELLRFSLETGRHPLVALRQELKVVRDYLEIEQTRFGERLRFTLDVPAVLEELEVPPMALQTLVENSIKHAIAASRQGGEVRVAARLESGSLLLEVSDDGAGFDQRALREGHGLENLQERLAELFDGQGRLELARRDGRMVVTVTVPQKRVLV
ncbi:MAG TPA: histidine kinase [Candidatus Sulfopaludibacter sp.]|nr:histidine kinase [Candidatus Sulfopaludibacter sp.]